MPWAISHATRTVTLLVVLLTGARGAEADDWYVDAAASGANDGSSWDNAWQNFADISWGSVSAGDNILVRAGQYAEMLQVGASGEAGSPITIRKSGDGEVAITGVAMCMRIIDRAYVSIRGISCVATGEYVEIRRSHHIEVAHGDFVDSTRKDGWPVGFRLVDDSHHNWIHDNTIGSVGYATAEDNGGVINVGRWEDNQDLSHYNLIENNVFFHGGHHIMEMSSSYNVVRNNHWHNEEWMNDGQFGNRHLVTDGPGNNAGWNLIEGNTFATCGVPPDDTGVAGVSLRSQSNIVRRNIFYDNDTAGLNISSPGYHATSFDPPGNVRHNRIYHNVMFHNGYATHVTDPGLLGGISFLQYGASDEIELVYIKNNIMWDNNLNAIAFESSDRGLQIIEDNWEEEGDPLFVDDEAAIVPAQPELLDFRLQEGSPCMDNGGFLTVTTAAGSGTAIPVEDAGYFMDGWGIDHVAGDQIQLEGQTIVATITSVDYDDDSLTVDREMSWTAGLGVGQPFADDAPDQGAYEFGYVDTETPDAGVSEIDSGAGAPDAGSSGGDDDTTGGCGCRTTNRAGHLFALLLGFAIYLISSCRRQRAGVLSHK